VTLLEYTFLAGSSLFVIVDPIATAPAFLAMTMENTPAERFQMARIACTTMTAVLLLFALAGSSIFKFLGITLPAFQMAASIVLLLVALDMLRGQRSRVHETAEETAAGVIKPDIAITPLAVPMLAGPGAISTAILLQSQAQNFPQRIALYLCIATISAMSFLILALAARTSRWMNPIALKLTERLMGLLLASIAFQFLVNALRGLKLIPAA
jgi:multiple antibiotic resistance protein